MEKMSLKQKVAWMRSAHAARQVNLPAGITDHELALQIQSTQARADSIAGTRKKNPLRRGPLKGKVPPQLRKYLFKRGRR